MNRYGSKILIAIWIIVSAGCTVTSKDTHINNAEPVPLNLILDALKGELRAVNRALHENPKDFAFSCNGNLTPANVFFKEIIVDLTIGNSKTGVLGAEAKLESGGGLSLSAQHANNSSHENTVTIYIIPEVTSVYYKNDTVTPGGVADILTQTMLQLIAADDTQPCLNIGYEGENSVVIKMEFKTETVLKAEGDIDFVVLRVEGEGSRKNSYSHTLTAKIDIRQKPAATITQVSP